MFNAKGEMIILFVIVVNDNPIYINDLDYIIVNGISQFLILFDKRLTNTKANDATALLLVNITIVNRDK